MAFICGVEKKPAGSVNYTKYSVKCDVVSDYAVEDSAWVTDPSLRRKIDLEDKKDYEGNAPYTFIDLFQKAVKENGDRKVMVQPQAIDCGIQVAREWTMTEYYEECRGLAKALIAAGVEKHTGVAIQGFNGPEWLFANNAAVFAGAMSAGVYPTQTVPVTEYQLNHCQARVVFIDDRKQLAKILQMRDNLKSLKYVVIWREDVQESDNVEGKAQVLTYRQFAELGREVPEHELDARMEGQTPENAMTLIYTSGTTGMPKAVMLSHDNVTWTVGALALHKDLADRLLNHCGTHRGVSYLPLSHIAGAMLDIYMPLWFNAFFTDGHCVTFARPDALKAP